MADERNVLSIPLDEERFAELERVIECGLGMFVDVGRALLEIQQGRLYRPAGHRTFADYVVRRWDLSGTHAYRQIEAAKVVAILSPIEKMPLPANEAQARELAPLVDDPEAVRAVWAETVRRGEGRVTARAIRARGIARHPRARPTGQVPLPRRVPSAGTTLVAGRLLHL